MTVVVKMFGGLGGQMFQYALGRAIAIRNDDSLELDISGFKGTGRNFELWNYNIQAALATNETRDALRTHPLISPFMPKSSHIKERNRFIYEPRVESVKGDVYLDGYWVNEWYFKHIESAIRKDFTLRRGMGCVSQGYLEGLLTYEDPVAVHFRRTDYPNEIGKKYYEAAVSEMLSAHPKATFFVFSDGDIATEDYGIRKGRYVNLSNSGNKPHEDMYLMSRCKHHIISNSTFAWWGAWLGKSEEQLVFTPKTWFLDRPTPDALCPKGWLRVENDIYPRVPEKLKC